MKLSLLSIPFVTSAVLARPASYGKNTTCLTYNSTLTNTTRKFFLDNDGYTTTEITLPLLANSSIVGISASFGSASMVDSLGSAYAILNNYSLTSCVPLYAGASTPLLRTKEDFEVWETLFGDLVWTGTYSSEYVDTYNTSYAKYDSVKPGAMALIEAVRKYPGEIEIYAAGMMTTIAQAVSLWPEIVNHVKAVWIMGGYLDNQYSQVTGSQLNYDINSDFNMIWDPEAAQMVLTAGFKDVYIGGNVTNYIYPTQSMFDKLQKELPTNSTGVTAAISSFVGNGNASSVTLPLWDEAVSAFMSFPELITDMVNVSVAIDTSYSSPFYGQLRVWPYDLAPTKGRIGNATLITAVNTTNLLDKVYDALSYDFGTYCLGGCNATSYHNKTRLY